MMWRASCRPGCSTSTRGAEELIDDLLATGIDTASLSNTNATHWRRMFAIDGATPEFPTTSRLKYHAPSHEPAR